MQSGAINFADFGMTDQQVNNLASAGKTVDWEDTGFFDMFAITSAPASQVGALANPLVRQAMAYAHAIRRGPEQRPLRPRRACRQHRDADRPGVHAGLAARTRRTSLRRRS